MIGGKLVLKMKIEQGKLEQILSVRLKIVFQMYAD